MPTSLTWQVAFILVADGFLLGLGVPVVGRRYHRDAAGAVGL